MIKKEIDPNVIRQNIRHLEELEHQVIPELDKNESITPKTNKGYLTQESKISFFEEMIKKLKVLKEKNEIEEFYTQVQGGFKDKTKLNEFLNFQELTLNNFVLDVILVKKYQHNTSETSKVLRFGINPFNKKLSHWVLTEYNPSIQKTDIVQISDIASVFSKSNKNKEQEAFDKSKAFQELQLKAAKQITSVEKSIVMAGIDYLNETERKTVLVDIFARHNKDDKYKIGHSYEGQEYRSGHIKYNKDGSIETHTVVLYNQGNKYLVIDPSNAEFSAILAGVHNDIRVCLSKKFQVYQPIEKAEENNLLGNNPDQWRDCIDIAVKLAFNLNQNDQLIEFEKFHEAEVIKTDSLKNNIFIQEITNNSDSWKFLPGELDFYPLRSKQSSNIVDIKKIHAGLKVFHYISKQLKGKIMDLKLTYAQKAIDQEKENYFKKQYSFDEYNQSYDDLLSLSKSLKDLNEIELLGLETKVIEQTFNE